MCPLWRPGASRLVPATMVDLQHGADGERQSRNLLKPSPWARLVAIRNCLCCNLAAGMRRPPRRRPSERNVSDVDMLETKGDSRDRAADAIVGLRQWKVIP